MQQVEINTSQNVKIEYQLASVGHRIFAFMIDFAILLIGSFIFYLAIVLNGLDENNVMYYFIFLLLIVWVWFYTLGSEIIGNGQTLGKLALGIKVVKLNGDEMEFYRFIFHLVGALIRCLFFGWCFGHVAYC